MYIDAHAHLDKYELELPQVIKEIEQHEIITISVSMDPEAYAKSKAIDQRTQWVLSTFGVHPWNAPAFHTQLESLQPLIDDSPMLGEIGLDYHFISEPQNHALQRDVFQYFVKQGISQKKILNIHSTGAEADVDRILGDLGASRAIVHWYSGPIEQLQSLAEKGVYFTVGVEVLFSAGIQKIAKTIPSALLLTESDNPGGFRWLTGVLGMPSIISSVIQRVSDLRGWSPEETKNIVQHNFLRLVHDDYWAKGRIEAKTKK
ncbi:MAG: TatD family hydrolase [Acidobacteriia bacterium]|nr:TatD family hydrolase [Terriglobia bacterium]